MAVYGAPVRGSVIFWSTGARVIGSTEISMKLGFLDKLYRVNGGNLKIIWSNPGLFFVYFRPFLIPTSITISIIQIEKSVDGVLGIRTRSRRMVGADKTMEQRRAPWRQYF